MKNFNSILASSLVILLIYCVACGRKHTAEPTSDALRPVSEQEAMETQKNINRYFHSQVIPKLVNGWKELKDTNKFVTYHYEYLKRHNRWEFNGMDVVETTLSPHNDTVAQRFMAKAVVGTIFTI